MKIIGSIILLLLVFLLVRFFMLGQTSRTGSAPGMVDGKLAPCPDKPNCVCSDTPTDHEHQIAALQLPPEGLPTLIAAIQKTGGVIQQQQAGYLAVTYTSSLFGFVDDVEFRQDADNPLLWQVRSASRVGYSDLGANRKRVEAIRAAL